MGIGFMPRFVPKKNRKSGFVFPRFAVIRSDKHKAGIIVFAQVDES